MSNELLRIVDSIHRDKNIDIEVVIAGIESAIVTAARKHFGEEGDIVVKIDRHNGSITATFGGEPIDPDTLGRISAQMAKQIIIQKIREAERDAIYDDFVQERGTIITGSVQRHDGGVVTVNLGKTEALLPRGEQMPGESYRPGERVRAVITEVRKSGQRVKIIVSRTHPDFVRRLFEQEIPEIAEHIIEIRAVAREAGYRSKVAVSSIDNQVDCVGACVGMRGNRIKNILDELGGERIDIIRYNESLQVLIPNALAPAKVEEVQLYPRIGRAIVLVNEDQLSLAIGKRGQNVRLASKLAGVDIEIMTFDELTDKVARAEEALSEIPSISEDIVDTLIVEGVLSYDDLSVIEVDQIMEITGLDEDSASNLILHAEEMAEAQPQEPSKRSSLLSGQSSRPPTLNANQVLGPAEQKIERIFTAGEVFGDVEPRRREQKITAEQLFGNDKANVPEEPKAGDDDQATNPAANEEDTTQ